MKKYIPLAILIAIAMTTQSELSLAMQSTTASNSDSQEASLTLQANTNLSPIPPGIGKAAGKEVIGFFRGMWDAADDPTNLAILILMIWVIIILILRPRHVYDSHSD